MEGPFVVEINEISDVSIPLWTVFFGDDKNSVTLRNVVLIKHETTHCDIVSVSVRVILT